MNEHVEAVLFLILIWLMPLLFAPHMFTILFCKSKRQKTVAWFYTKYISPYVRHVVDDDIGQLFATMRRHDRLKTRNQLRIVEIGVGNGLNFKHYPKHTHLTAVESSTECLIGYNENRRRFPNVVVENTLITSAHDMSAVPTAVADVVVSTYVLCSVGDVPSIFTEIKRVLKPDGCLVFAEHTRYTDSCWKFLLQKLASPLLCLCCGIRTDLDLPQMLKKEFRKVDCRVTYPAGLLIPMRPHLTGIGWNAV